MQESDIQEYVLQELRQLRVSDISCFVLQVRAEILWARQDATQKAKLDEISFVSMSVFNINSLSN